MVKHTYRAIIGIAWLALSLNEKRKIGIDETTTKRKQKKCGFFEDLFLLEK